MTPQQRTGKATGQAGHATEQKPDGELGEDITGDGTGETLPPADADADADKAKAAKPAPSAGSLTVDVYANLAPAGGPILKVGQRGVAVPDTLEVRTLIGMGYLREAGPKD